MLFGGKPVVIKAAILPGKGATTPLLLSKELLKQLRAKIDTSADYIFFGALGVGGVYGVYLKGTMGFICLRSNPMKAM